LALSSSASSSSSSGDESGSMEKAQTAPLVAGLISPQTICSQRALSIPVTASNTSLNDLDEYDDVDVYSDSPAPSLSQQRPATRGEQQDRCHDYSYLRTTPAPMRSAAWAEPSAADYQVRGPDYMKYGGEKLTSAPAVFELLAVDLVLAPKLIYTGLCAQPNERIQLALAKEKQTGVRQLPPFVFAVNLCLPAGGTSNAGPDSCYHCVGYFGVDEKATLTNMNTPEGRLMNRFFFGDDSVDDNEFRDRVFKLIPRIVEGNFVVRKAVGSKPSLIGTKLKLQYVRTERYCEVLVDISSSAMAQKIVQLVLGYAKNLIVDMMFLFEGTDASTLPERILGGFRVCNVDFKHQDGQRMVE
jgi:hypothetical protein